MKGNFMIAPGADLLLDDLVVVGVLDLVEDELAGRVLGPQIPVVQVEAAVRSHNREVVGVEGGEAGHALDVVTVEFFQ
jgi:hypothetical protein